MVWTQRAVGVLGLILVVSHSWSRPLIALVDGEVDSTQGVLGSLLREPIHLVEATETTGGHGSAMAAVVWASVAALAEGGEPAFELLPVVVKSPDTSTPAAQVATGIRLACDAGADVVLVGLVGLYPSPEIDEAVSAATAANCLVVAPTGNEGADQVGGAAAAPDSLAVVALDRQGQVALQSNLAHDRPLVAAVAPLRSSNLGGGSSFAAAHVAGSALYLRARHPEASAVDVREALVRGARGVPGLGAQLNIGEIDVTAASGLLAVAIPRYPRIERAEVERGPGSRGGRLRLWLSNPARLASVPLTVEVAEGPRAATALPVEALAPWALYSTSMELPNLSPGARNLTVRLGDRTEVVEVPRRASREGPDLVITQLDIRELPRPGSPPVRLSATIENRGAQAAEVTVDFFIHDEKLPPAPSAPPLAPGQQVVVSTEWIWPASLQASEGFQRIKLMALVRSGEGEAELDNNLAARHVILSEGDDQAPQYADTVDPHEVIIDAPHYVRRDADYLPVLVYFPEGLPEGATAGFDGQDAFLSLGPQVLRSLRIWDVSTLAARFAAAAKKIDGSIHDWLQNDVDALKQWSEQSGAFCPGSADDEPITDSDFWRTVFGGTNTTIGKGDLFALKTSNINSRVKKAAMAAPWPRLIPLDRHHLDANASDTTVLDQLAASMLLPKQAEMVDENGGTINITRPTIDLVRRLSAAQQGDHFVVRLPLNRLQISSRDGRSFVRLLVQTRRTRTYHYENHNRKRRLVVNHGTEELAANYRVLQVQVGDAPPRLDKSDRYFDVHFHSIAETPGQNPGHFLSKGERHPLFPAKAFGGPLIFLAEAAAAIGLIETQGRRVDLALLRDQVIATDHNVFFSPKDLTLDSSGTVWSSKGKFFGSFVPAPTAAAMRALGLKREVEYFEHVFGLTWAEEVALDTPNLGAHALAYWTRHLDGPWYGNQPVILDAVKSVNDLALPRNSLRLEDLFGHADSAAPQPKGSFVFAAHPYQAAHEWQTGGTNSDNAALNYLDLAVGEDHNLVAHESDFRFKGLQFWNGSPDLTAAAGDVPFREFLVPYDVSAIEGAMLDCLYDFERAPGLRNETERKLWKIANGVLLVVMFPMPTTAILPAVGLAATDLLFPKSPKWDDTIMKPSPEWYDKLVLDRKDWMSRVAKGLKFAFNDVPDVRMYRKLFVAAGTDAHGDFNFEEGMVAKMLDDRELWTKLATALPIDLRQSLSSRAFGRTRTYVFSSTKKGSTWALTDSEGPWRRTVSRTHPHPHPHLPPPEEQRDTTELRAMEALSEGNSVLTNGPVFRFWMDSDVLFDSTKLEFEGSKAQWKNQDGQIGGLGRFDGGHTMLSVGGSNATNAAQLLDFWNRNRQNRWDSSPYQGSFLPRAGGGSPPRSAFKLVWKDSSDLGGGRYGLSVLRIPESAAAVVSEDLVGLQGERYRLAESWEGGEKSHAVLFELKADGGSVSPSLAMSNPIWVAPVTVTIDIGLEGVENGEIKCGELSVAFQFPISMAAEEVPVLVAPLDKIGNGRHGTTYPLRPLQPKSCSAMAEKAGWTRGNEGVRNGTYTVRNPAAIKLQGEDIYPPQSGNLRSFVVYFAAPPSTEEFQRHLRGPKDFHGNQLNSIAVLFSAAPDAPPPNIPPPEEPPSDAPPEAMPEPPPPVSPPTAPATIEGGRRCHGPEDCNPDEDCVEGFCQRRGAGSPDAPPSDAPPTEALPELPPDGPETEPVERECRRAIDCPRGQLCIEGFCRRRGAAPPEAPRTEAMPSAPATEPMRVRCRRQADCPDGQRCIRGFCQLR